MRALCARENMSPKNTIVFKSALGYFLFFTVLWLLVIGLSWLDPEKEILLGGLLPSFLVTQIPTVILTLLVKFKLDKNPIE
jgi:heme A synthase